MKTIHLQLTLTLDEATIKSLAELLATALNERTDEEKKREARLRASQNALFAGEKAPEDQGLLGLEGGGTAPEHLAADAVSNVHGRRNASADSHWKSGSV